MLNLELSSVKRSTQQASHLSTINCRYNQYRYIQHLLATWVVLLLALKDMQGSLQMLASAVM
jgi:hypothetical protein